MWNFEQQGILVCVWGSETGKDCCRILGTVSIEVIAEALGRT